MKKITFSSIKGGTGKTTTSILVANALASEGYRVLTIDMDIQNSMSFYYLDDADIIDGKNIALRYTQGIWKQTSWSRTTRESRLYPPRLTWLT